MFRRVTRNPMIGTLLLVILVAAALVNLVPFLWMLSTSLKPLSKVFAYPPEWIPNPIKWSNYPNALHVINPRVFLNSVIVTCSIVLIQGLVTTMGGFAFARLRFPFRDQLFLLYLGTILIPSQVTLIPSYIVIVHLGWVNTYQGIIAPVVAHGAFGTFLFRQFFLRIPDEYYEAARLDGANYWQQFWKLTLPLSRPVLSAYGILTFLNAWKLYLWPLIVVRSPGYEGAADGDRGTERRGGGGSRRDDGGRRPLDSAAARPLDHRAEVDHSRHRIERPEGIATH